MGVGLMEELFWGVEENDQVGFSTWLSCNILALYWRKERTIESLHLTVKHGISISGTSQVHF